MYKNFLLGFIFLLGFSFISPEASAQSISIGGSGGSIDIFGGGGSGGAGVPDGDLVLPDATEYNTIGVNTSLRGYILRVLNFALSFLGLIAVVAVIYAGYLYVTSAGDDSQIEKSKKTVIYAVIGILVVAISFALVNTIIKEALVGGDDRGGFANGGGGGSNGSATGSVNFQQPNGSNTSAVSSVFTDFAPGTVLPGGTVIDDGIILIEDTIVGPDGRVDIPSNLVEPTDLPEEAEEIQKLFSFQNGITVSGEGVQDLGNTVVITDEAGINGVEFGLTVDANAVFDFGDSTQGLLDNITTPGATINHKFGADQSFNIRAVAQLADGSVERFEKRLVVGGTDARFQLSKREILINEKIRLDASASRVSLGSIRDYVWSCDGGSGCFPEIRGKIVEVTFSEPGAYDVALTLNNTLGLEDVQTESIQVLSDKPTAAFEFSSTENDSRPAEIRFNARESKNVKGQQAGLTYEWDLEGVFRQTSTPELVYNFPSEGTKQVILKVTQNINGEILTSDPVIKNVTVDSAFSADFDISQ